MIYENPYPHDSWEAVLETMVQIGRGEVLSPPTNIRDLAKIVGKSRADVTLDPVGNFDKETLWAYASLMTHHLFWLKSIPFGYCLSRETTSDLYPDISTNLWQFDVIGLYKSSKFFVIDETIMAQSKANFFIFVRGNHWWLYPAWYILEWPIIKIGGEGAEELSGQYQTGYYLAIEGSESVDPEKPVKEAVKEKIAAPENADLFEGII